MSNALVRIVGNRLLSVGALLLALSIPLAVAATPTPPVGADPHGNERHSVVELQPRSGSKVTGQLTLVPTADGVHLTGTLRGFEARSVHGFHVHEKGDCSAVDASSAGDHFDPRSGPHGKPGSGTHHAGDLSNLAADDQGVVEVDVSVPGVTLGTGDATDVANRALVVHAAPDDYATQPAGNSGDRVACGVIPVPR